MKKYDSSNFKFRFEGERPDSIFQDQTRQPRGEAAGRRMAIFSIFILLIVGAAVVFAYTDIKKRFAGLQFSGNADVENLTKNLDSKFSSLSIQQAKFEETLLKIDKSLSEKVERVEKRVSGLEGRFKKTETLARTIGKSKLGRDELKTALSRIDKTVAPIQKTLKNITADLDSLDKNLTEELTKIEKNVTEKLAAFSRGTEESKDQFEAFREDLTALSNNMVNQKKFILALKTEEKIYREHLTKATEELENRIDSIQAKMNALGKNADRRPVKRKLIKKKAASHKSESTIKKKTADKTLIPKPGKIIEQNID
ncbi:MAG: hypothetical protein ACE5DO_02290 [Desulfobacterales bacterium]